MLEYSSDLRLRNDSGESYSFDADVYSPYDYKSGKVDKNGYNIVFNGSKHFLRLPAVKNFRLHFDMAYKDGLCNLIDSDWGVVFGYDDETRFSYVLNVKHLYWGETQITLSSQIDEHNLKIIKQLKYSYNQNLRDIHKCELNVENGNISFRLDGYDFNCEVDAIKGRFGFYRGDSFKEIVISNLSFVSDDVFSCEKIIPKTEFIIPQDNGNCTPYRLSVQVDKIDNLYRVKYLFKSDLFDKEPSSIVGDVWAFMFEDLTDAFIRIGNGERLYLFNGSIRLTDDNYDNVPLKENTVAIYENLYNVKRDSLNGEFYLRKIPEDFTVSFGYKNLLVSGAEYYGGEREFVFDKVGNLLESGDLTDEIYRVLVKSPINKRIEKYILENCKEQVNALKHLEGNHYFDFDDKIVFFVKAICRSDEDLAEIEFRVTDAYFNELNVEINSVRNGNDFTLSASGLPIGVYHLSVKIKCCGRVVKEHCSAFSVLDPECKRSPQKESGLPELYVNDGAPANLKTTVQDPWNTKNDSNVNHYHSISHFLPQRAEMLEAWGLLDQYNKKLLVWCTQRAIDRKEYLSGDIEKLNVLKHADYINYGYPGIEDSRIYYRYDYFEKEVYDGALRNILQNFLNERPDVVKKLGYCNVKDNFSTEQFRSLLSLCSSEWIEYANIKIKELFDRQWERIKKLNPKAKRQSYGPWNAYQSPLIGAYSSKWFGGDPKRWNEIIDGFYQFEDYPFVCGYSTTRGAWGLSTLGLLCPEVKVYPEIYNGFKAGCPDGFVSCALPPLGNFSPENYLQATQIAEYVYNTAVFSGGKYRYWDNRGFMMFSLFTQNPEEKYKQFLKTWGVIKSNIPKRPCDKIAFVYEFDVSEDRVDLSFDTHAFYNISECNESYLYKIIRENGFGGGVVLDFDGLLRAKNEDFKAIVLPCLDNISKPVEKTIRDFHSRGVPLIATGSVGNLFDIFGVSENRVVKSIREIEYRGNKESVTLVDAEFRYLANEGCALVETTDNVPAFIKHGNTFLLNSSVCQIGVDNYRRLPYNSRNNISKLLEKAIAEELSNVLKSNFSCSDKCGLTLFETENGDKELLIINYSGTLVDGDYSAKKIIRVDVNENFKINDITDMKLSGDVDVTFVKREKKVVSFSVELSSKQACLLKLT